MLSKESRLLGFLHFVTAMAIGAVILGASLLGGLMSFVILALTLPNPASLTYYETVTLYTYLVYVLIVTLFIYLAARKARKRLVGIFLIVAAMFWLIHDAIPLGPWTALGLITVAALPLYQILVRRARH